MCGHGKSAGRGIRMSQAEADRIRRVYAAYDADPAVQRRWRPANPGNAANRAALKRQIAAMSLRLEKLCILEVGCGSGDVLALLCELGAAEEQLTGVDLRGGALNEARARFPRAKLVEANAEALPLPDETFDLVAMFTVMSSVLSPGVRQAIARETARVLRPGGLVLWYDMRRANPWNPNVRAVSTTELLELFPGFDSRFVAATLLPQLARRLGPVTKPLFSVLHAVPAMRSHWLGTLKKPATS
jgi:SAM-dependent methyltransferase